MRIVSLVPHATELLFALGLGDEVVAVTHECDYPPGARELPRVTRDALPACKPGDPGEKVSCWPAPENPETMNRKQLGDLKLSDTQEDLLVAFLKTLTDGYSPPEK